MKTKLFLLLLLASGFALQSCSDDDNKGNPGNVVVENAFKAKYPNAGSVDWERKSDFYVVDFWLEGKKMEAWFDGAGQWYMTETEITKDQLPEAVKIAFNQSEYASWYVDDVDKLERVGMDLIYIVEVKQGGKEYDLYYSADGTLIKAVPDTNGGNEHYLPTSLPQKASTYITTNHPNAKILEVERKVDKYEVDIVEAGVYQELVFTATGDWIYTKKDDIPQSQVPQKVLDAIKNSSYGSYTIDEVDYYTTPSGSYYYFELKSGSTEAKVKVDVNGNILS